MALRSILVHLDARRLTPDRVAFAAALALQHQAHLVGLAPTGWADMPAEELSSLRVREDMLAAMSKLREEAEACVRRFETQIEGLGVPSFEAHVEPGTTASVMEAAAPFCDLSVVSQHDANEWVTTQSPEMPQSLLLRTGRPVLVLPCATRPVPRAPTRVLVAWNASREAARALHDALPVLKRAAQVQVAIFDAPPDLDQRFGELPGVEIGHWLARHGVQAEVITITTQLPVGEALLSHAAAWEAELIVAGGYGHSRVRETLLGGVTRTLLKKAQIPVLLSH